MGTGIVSILIHNLPYNAAWLQYASYVFFALNVALFVTFTGMTIVRYTLYPEIWVAMINHPGQSLFLGTFPMGFASMTTRIPLHNPLANTGLAIINMIVMCCASWGDWAIYMAWGFWWFDVVISLACAISLPFIV